MKQEKPKNPHNIARNNPQNGAITSHGLILAQQEHHGPLPDPRTLEQYDSIVPGAAERILVMAEQNSQHAITMDREILQAQIEVAKQNHTESIRGQYCAIVGVLAMAGVAAYAIAHNYPTVAGIICSTTIVGLVAIFVTGRKQQTGSENGKNKGSA